jgi:hypothetical protein
MQINIQWDEACKVSEQQQQQQKKETAKRNDRIQEAKESFYDKLGNENFRLDDFYDTLSDYDIDSDDLFHALI